jgi:hypothetical protein
VGCFLFPITTLSKALKSFISNRARYSWGTLWLTKIGEGETAIPIAELDVPAMVAGFFFEKLFARELQLRFPSNWRGGRSKDEKDLVFLPNSFFSTEMKTSGQLGTKIYGNRSYGQKAEAESLVTKTEKSGYYISVNFYGKTLTLIRFGWIDEFDWKPQASSTGQAASLPIEVYQNKLIEIPGDYRLSAPVGILEGIGRKRIEIFAKENVKTIQELLDYEGKNKAIISRSRNSSLISS